MWPSAHSTSLQTIGLYLTAVQLPMLLCRTGASKTGSSSCYTFLRLPTHPSMPRARLKFQSPWILQHDLELTILPYGSPYLGSSPGPSQSPHFWSLWPLPPWSHCIHHTEAVAHDFLLSFSPTLPIRSTPNYAWNMTHHLPQLLDTQTGGQRGKRTCTRTAAWGRGTKKTVI